MMRRLAMIGGENRKNRLSSYFEYDVNQVSEQTLTTPTSLQMRSALLQNQL